MISTMVMFSLYIFFIKCRIKLVIKQYKYIFIMLSIMNITYDFALDDFQKTAIKAINDNNHILVTAHTGSGKTLPAEYAIQKYCSQGKKVVYTGPVKSLSNQKFHDFSRKFPGISFGIMTGDIKFNPEADCIIMTTEILRNSLYTSSKTDTKSLSFNLNMEDVACVIFDEVHYINDEDRGKVWEECIMKMPDHVQMLMLSATIDKEKEFAEWIQNLKQKDVIIASTNTRVIPLKHYMYYITNSGFNKYISSHPSKYNTELLQINREINNAFIDLKDDNDTHYNDVYKLDKYVNKNRLKVDKKHVINTVVKKLFDNKMLPAICFVFSRKNVEYYASFIEFSLFDPESESEKPHIIENECRKILMKFANYKEYINLPEYHNIITLLQKGIAIHHSGILPVLREMIEILFSMGYVKLLFATETFSVGINMPTKTVLFTNLSKFSNNGFRNLYSHEYTQMAGRAGRRGLDSVGHVIHLNNMFELPEKFEYNRILSGKPQALVSKFNTHPSIVLKMFEDDTKDKISYLETSMNYLQIKKQIDALLVLDREIENNVKSISNTFKRHSVNTEDISNYYNKSSTLHLIKPKKRKVIERELSQIKSRSCKNFDEYVQLYSKQLEYNDNIVENINHIDKLTNAVGYDLECMVSILEKNDFIKDNTLTNKGIIASNMNETNGLIMSEIISSGELDDIDINDFIMYISLFTKIRISSDIEIKEDYIFNIGELTAITKDKATYYYDLLLKNNFYVNEEEYVLCNNIMDLVYEWSISSNEQQAKNVILKCKDRGIFVGEFVKSLLKIVNVANEINNVSKQIKNIKLEYITSQVEEKLLKFIATNQSLYI